MMEVIAYEATNGFLQTNGDSVLRNECDPTPKDNNDTTTTFTRLPQRQPVDIQFENITYTASLGFHKGKKEILHQINGRLPSGQLIAIMGPSGAGKSTLLDVLSGYKIKGVEGTVYTNGVSRSLKAFRKLSCYITQDDRLQPLLTVDENMHIAADLKLPSYVSQQEKNEIIDEVLTTLGLAATKNTEAGGLSGGQKKRLSIALELINNPLVMFLDEPTTGLDSSSCSQCVRLLKDLASQGRTIICTIHQPSASLFQLFDQVYVLAAGTCLYQGSTGKLVSFLQDAGFPCPMYHNPADYVIELACGEYGNDKIEAMVNTTSNGRSLMYFEKPDMLPNVLILKEKIALDNDDDEDDQAGMQATSSWNQLKVLLRRNCIKTKRDRTLTYMRLGVNIIVAIMLGALFWQAGFDGSKTLSNYNLLFSILMHHMMSTMMLMVLTFPNEMSILIKEHFNRWYSLKMYYASITLIDIPISVISCFLFSVIIYWMTGQPLEFVRFNMFFITSILVVFVAQSFGLMIGAVFDVVNGTFIAPVLSVPMMMFAGFGVRLSDLPWYFSWGSYISYLRYGLEGYVNGIYGLDRSILSCPEDKYCHYKYPKKLLSDVGMKNDQFYNAVIFLSLILFSFRVLSFVLLKYKLMAVR